MKLIVTILKFPEMLENQIFIYNKISKTGAADSLYSFKCYHNFGANSLVSISRILPAQSRKRASVCALI